MPAAATTVPFIKYTILQLAPWLYVAFVTFVVTGSSNAVNMTDGLDGLAAGLTAIAAAAFAFFAYVFGRVDTTSYLQFYYLPGSGELTVFCAALMGAALGFLWFNAHPAQVFMGDTGALAIGGGLGTVSILLKAEFLLLIIGGVFVAEQLSVMLQMGVYKWFKRTRGREYADAHRVFRMAPLHHHFEKMGWAETDGGHPVLHPGHPLRAAGARDAQAPVMSSASRPRAARWPSSAWGGAASRRPGCLLRAGRAVYASDCGTLSRAGRAGARAARRSGPRSISAATTWSGSPGPGSAWSRPGCRPDAPPLAAARQAGVPIQAEAELGLEALAGVPYVAITGTNGKTTTTALVGHLLASGGPPRGGGGQHRHARSPRSRWSRSGPSGWRSSCPRSSCTTWPRRRPAVGVLTNLAPDHLDRYAALEDYYADKARLFAARLAAARSGSPTPTIPRRGTWSQGVPGRHLRFSVPSAGRRLVRPRAATR